jgi:BirA family biotin operon repressor/biotin-[acetyl-CoA-carboxylase] ligase
LQRPLPSSPAIDLRWPNDVLLNGRKCAGILAHVDRGCVIAGIGINVHQREFPPGLDTPATSLLLEGIRAAREALLIALVQAVDHSCALPAAEILRQFAAASTFADGRRVHAEAGGTGIVVDTQL